MPRTKQSAASGSDAAVQQPASPTNAALQNLSVFIGEWELEITSISSYPAPSTVERGHASFEWLEGGAFLIQRLEIAAPDFPRSTAIIAPDDAAETYGMLYFDSRGVSRIYKMTFSGGIWTLWRDFPGFAQRFHGTFSDDGNFILARWEKSTDGSHWKHDFEMKYTKVG